jgi:hypothetical protein
MIRFDLCKNNVTKSPLDQFIIELVIKQSDALVFSDMLEVNENVDAIDYKKIM